MKRNIAIAAFALALISTQARADEHRGGDAALGALSGAVVLTLPAEAGWQGAIPQK